MQNIKVFKVKNYEKKLKYFIIFITFVTVFMSSFSQEYVSDDLIYMNRWGVDTPLSNLSDIIYFQIKHYMTWGGRTVAHSVLQLLFLLGKPFSSVLNSLIFVLCSYLIVIYACKKFNVYIFSFVAGSLYFLNPNYSETVRWLTGSANYLWTTTIVLISMLPFVYYYKDKELSLHLKLLIAPFSFLAGWCNENISTSLIIIMTIIILDKYKRTKKIDKYLMLLTLFSIIGCCALILAPGNFIRTSTFQTGIMAIAYRIHGQINAWFNWLFPSIIILIVTYYYLHKNNKKQEKLSSIFCLWGVLSILIMIASPTYPSRAAFGTFVLFLIPISMNIESLINYNLFDNKLFKFLAVLVWLASIFTNVSIFSVDVARLIGYNIPH